MVVLRRLAGFRRLVVLRRLAGFRRLTLLRWLVVITFLRKFQALTPFAGTKKQRRGGRMRVMFCGLLAPDPNL
ncbi:hypothetical protein BK009_01080 [Methanobacterium subterraneum]|uniref:Uncharacterized protein n=1 Tax=Methanobacterium subterraneum TaxID=59277 RepID=A0A2H4VMR7_9EURY|nr:hypothetical protein BK009_01080 [Methanobacterium subterraneum]